MSSAPSTPAATESPEKPVSTPSSSPPPMRENVTEDPKGAQAKSGVSKSMEDEERQMAEASRHEEEARDRKLREQREADMKGGTKAVDSKFKALEYLLSQSKVSSDEAHTSVLSSGSLLICFAALFDYNAPADAETRGGG